MQCNVSGNSHDVQDMQYVVDSHGNMSGNSHDIQDVQCVVALPVELFVSEQLCAFLSDAEARC